MSEITKIGSLEIEPDAQHLSTTFLVIQKIGIVIMVLILFCTLLGFFGSGIFGQTQEKGKILQIQYDRFARTQSTTILNLNIDLRSLLQQSNYVTIWINQSFFKNMSIKSITPQPIAETSVNDKIFYTFHRDLAAQTLQIVFVLNPESFGKMDTQIGIENIEQIDFKQFIYP